MKYLFSIICILTILASAHTQQMMADVQEGIHPMSQGSYAAFSMKVPSVSAKFIHKKWKAYIKQYKGKTKYDKKMQETFSDNAKIKDMSANTVDIYARVVGANEEEVELQVWFNLGVNYVSSQHYPNQAQKAFLILEEFMNVIQIDLIKLKIKEAKAQLKADEKELKRLEKLEKKMNDEVKKYEKKIQKIQQQITLVEEEKLPIIENQATQKTVIKDREDQISTLHQDLQRLKRK